MEDKQEAHCSVLNQTLCNLQIQPRLKEIAEIEAATQIENLTSDSKDIPLNSQIILVYDKIY